MDQQIVRSRFNQMDDRDEVNLRELVQLIWSEKWIIISLTLLVTIGGTAIGVALPKEYDALAVISPVSNNSNGKFAGQSSAVGGLASLIGISIGGDTNKAESIAVLQSEALTERYIREHDLLPVLFPNLWDPVNHRWRVASDRAPTLWKGNKVFTRIRDVVEDKKSGLVTVTIRWTDPTTAARWVNDLIKLTNDYLREKAIRESDQHIAYLNQEAAKTDVSQVRAAIYTVLESEIKNVMLARGPGDYALKVIDPAVPPENKAFPKLSIFMLVGFVAGVFLSTLVVFLRHAWRSAPRLH
jgi:uncharacterized protein involved in exopolysaccharide biosynthesis